MVTIDLNCDMGEGMPYDADIMPYISSVNIACGFHAGNEEIMKKTVELALQKNVAIGAHPGFADKENFGRKEMDLPQEKLYAIIIEQLIKIDLIAKEKRGRLVYYVPRTRDNKTIKPGGLIMNKARYILISILCLDLNSHVRL